MADLNIEIIEEGLKRGLPMDVIKEAVKLSSLQETRVSQLNDQMKKRAKMNYPKLTMNDIGKLYYDDMRPVTDTNEAFRILQNASYIAGANYSEEELMSLANSIVVQSNPQ